MRSLLSQLVALGPELALFILTAPILDSPRTLVYAQDSIPSPNLDLSQLGRVAIAGDFDSISLYTYQGQTESVFSTNGSQSLLTRYPNGEFYSVGMADASIMTMCPFVANGTLAGVVVGGNFTSLGGVEAQAIALWNPNTTEISALPGLSGKVQALYCDSDAGMVYVGGSFTGANSTNAMAWTTGWTNLPFAGFNGPVSSITKNSNGNIVFGGQFDGLGNTTSPKNPDVQVINLASGYISSQGTAPTDGYNNPENILCKTAQEDGPTNTWLLANDGTGYWQGNYSFSFIPTKLRLYNTNIDGRGTKTFYYQDMTSGGILNMEYNDENGNKQSCSLNCPLAHNQSSQDFHFVPPVAMNSFRLHLTEWYGPGAGLSGMELFTDDIYSFAVNDFNEPKCDSVSLQGSSSTASPANVWSRKSGDTSSDYLTANLTDTSQISSNTSVVFTPDIKQSGNYTVTVYTPGCIQDNTCLHRGQVNVTGTFTSAGAPVSSTIFQTNNYDKFDTLYHGYVDVDTDSFQPSVTLTPQAGQSVPLTVVAQRIRFELVTTTGGLNGLFEYNPNKATVSTDFSSSAIDLAGAKLGTGATINAVASYKDQIYAAGNFSASGISNAMSIGSNATALPGGGLNSEVQCLFQNGSSLYFGGNFSNTADSSVDGLGSVALFDLDGQKWIALGAGVNGPVSGIVPLSLNVTSNNPEQCLTVNGDFTSVNKFGSNSSFDAAGFAIWVPSRMNWLNNIPESDVNINGKLDTYTNVPGYNPIYAGQLTSQGEQINGAAELVGSGQPSLQSLGLKLQTTSSNSSSSNSKRSITPGQNYTGVFDGIYYGDNGLNITVLGGSFSTTATNGSTVENLVFINNTDSNQQVISGISGLESDSTFAAMDTYGTLLFAGGQIRGDVNGNDVRGLVVYDLQAGAFASIQPPALAGDSVIVNAVATQPKSSAVYVGGNFASAGSLPCSTICYYDANTRQWNDPGSGLSGTIVSMTWSSDTQLILAGNLTISGNKTTMATFDSKTLTFTQLTTADPPGPITAMVPADGKYSQFWATGTASNNDSVYLSKYSGGSWTGVGGFGAGTIIRSLQVLALTQNHDNTDLVPKNQILMLSGNINIPNYGNASAALFNGTTFQPFVLASKADGTQGSLSGMFVSNPQSFMNVSGHHLALGLVVLVGLAIALALMFILVVAGLVLERSRRRREGYVPMPLDRTGNLQRIPPETLLGGLEEKHSPPKL
ncbi:Hypothetical protein R9X50_00555300 [Acrodontium crateriforme]|uniref:Cellular morphogenesis protein n=1 Tax=Acrodontium crateriforme TaxID=150365 RepID=A0AAQ3MCP8_9PEZI|nr:Hypothetical protein R9X50_00555300 [Acrodontium crateriforme]